MKRKSTRSLSILMVLALLAGVFSPGFSALDIITHEVDIYANGASVTERIVLKESDTLQLTATLIDCSMPEGGYFFWESDTPILASVDQNGLLRAHDSSKGAMLRLWIDNDVRPIPIVGNTVANGIEALFNGMDVDAMDAEGILDVVQKGASILPGDLADSLIDSLRERLNSLDTGIKVTLYDGDGNVRATDEVRVAVNKSDALTADYFPNGTTITNKALVPATVEVGYAMQLQAVTTPMRVRMGVTWTLKEGKDFATLTDEGFVTFTKPGKVVVMASPDAKGFMDNIVKWADLVGDQDPEQVANTIAGLLVKLGLPLPQSVVKYVLWGLLYLAGTDNLIRWSEGAIVTVANYLMRLGTNDTVTVNVVQNIPVTSFSIAGTTTVQEGASQQLALTNIIPRGATAQGVVWQTAHPDYIRVGASDGKLFGRDAGASAGTRNTTVSATLDGITVSRQASVTGKALSSVIEVDITGPAVALIGAMAQMTYKTYPARLPATITWGILADDGKTELFATATTSAENSIARINRNGILTPLDGGTVTIIAKTSDTVKCYYKLFVGTLVTGLSIAQAPNVAVSVPLSQNYKNATATLTPVFTPADATNKRVVWSSNNPDVEVNADGVVSPAKNAKCFAVITATSVDGGYTASCVVSFANYPVTGITVDKTNINLFEGGTSRISADITPKGFLGMGAASITDVWWSSSDPAVATVSSNGTVTAVSPGNAVITATTVDGFLKANTTVSVRANKAALNDMITIVTQANLNPDDYAPEDFAVFIEALEAAYLVQSTELATQAECDEAMQYLAINFNALNQYQPLRGVVATFNGADSPAYVTENVGTVANYANQSLQFSYRVIPEDADYKSITWSSSNSAMSVNSSGKCSPNNNDPTWSVITVRAEDFIGNVYTSSVNVAFARVPATGISINTTSIPAALVHNTFQLNATVTPTGTIGIGAASIPDVQWVSADPSVATVSGSGLITCVGPGSTTISAITRDGGHRANCTINVAINKTQLEAAINTVNNANLDYSQYTPVTWDALLVALARAQEVYADPNAVQADIDDATSKLNTAYTGLRTYIYVNSVTIYEGSNTSDFFAKNVGLTANYTNQTIELSPRMSPLDSYYESIVWSSNSSAVSVTQDGVCRPTSNNACFALITVTVTTYYGRVVTDSAYVSFAKTPATRVDLTPTSINASIGNAPQTISHEVENVALITTNANIQTVLWSSSNPSAVSVNQNGTVNFLDAGTAKIRATSVDGGVFAECTVVVSGNKTALGEAIAFIDSLNLNVQDYEYSTSTAFSNAYNHAVEVFNGTTYSQQEIDDAAAALYATYEALQPYIRINELVITRGGTPVSSHISVKVELWQIYSNQSVQLGYTFAPANAMYTSIVWSSNDESIEVNQSGLVKPSRNRAGGALITLTATDHFGNKLTDSVFVAFANYPVTGISIDKTALSATVGDGTVTINASFTPTGDFAGTGKASVQKTYWTSSDPTVASVNQSGVVTYVDAGQCIITATSYDGDFSKTCAVTVYANKISLVNAINAIQGFAVDPELYTPSSWAVFEAAMNHAVAVRDEVFAKQAAVNSARDQLLAAFDALEQFIPINAVQVTFDGSMSNPGYVTRDVPLTSTYQSQSIQLGYMIFPMDATVTSVAWSSNSGSISVDQNGLCKPTANNACNAVITVTVTDFEGNVRTGTMNVAFANYPVTGVSVSPTSITNAITGGSATLSAEVTPTGTLGVGAANIKGITWSSSNTDVATVNASGTVNYISSGTVTITATTIDGGFTAGCEITVSANKAALLTALNTQTTLTPTNYTPASWQAMMTVYNASMAVYNNPLASQAEVDTARTNLLAAYAALVQYIYINTASVAVNGVNQNGYVIERVPEGTAISAASRTLGVVFAPQNAMYANISWASNNANISVSQAGVARPTVDTPCFATITATITDNYGNKYYASAVVAFVRVGVESITVSPNAVNAAINGGTVQLTATITGDNGQTPDFGGIVWSTSNPAVASVTQAGLVTIGIGGMAFVTASTELGELKAVCTVNVNINKSALAAIIDAVLLANYKQNDYTSESYAALVAALAAARTVYANPASDQNAVDQATTALTSARNGLVPYQAVTAAIILRDGTTAPDYISRKVELWQQYSNQTIQLTASVSPSGAPYTSAVWSSNHASITVDQTGLCKPSENKAGAAAITLTVTDTRGNVFTDSVIVAFANYQVTGVTLDHATLTFFYGGAAQTLTPEVSPTGLLGAASASIKSVTWKSSNTDVATVDANGVVTPVRAGTAVITVTTNDGGKTATCAVTVNGPRIVPATGSPAVVDYTRKVVYGIPEGTTDLSGYLTTPYGELVYTPTSMGFGTGTRIDLMYNNILVDSYYLVIFGDADGDGFVTAADAVFAAFSHFNIITLSDLQKFALDLNGDGKVNNIDAQIIENAGLFLTVINQTKPF